MHSVKNSVINEPIFVYDPLSPTGIKEPVASKPSLVSLFSGAGGLDLGFEKAGFKTLWANEFDKSIAPSYRNYFKHVQLDTRSITLIDASEIPFAYGLIGGPPCQSWSEAGAKRGIEDSRGQLFNDYIRILRHLQPKFFVVENVHGLIHQRNRDSFDSILKALRESGYQVTWKLLKASDYGVAQDRERVFIVGLHNNLNETFEFPPPVSNKVTLKDAIGDLNCLDIGSPNIKNHEITDIGFSPIFMSRNRVRSWDEPSYTILASDRHIPLHPNAPKMVDNPSEPGMKMFVPGKEDLYRRLSIRECARVQSFPDDYEFIYSVPRIGYKMIGNAVPVQLAFHVAKEIGKYIGVTNWQDK